MKVYIVLSKYDDLEHHADEFEECFRKEEDAYKCALKLANESQLKQFYVIERDIDELPSEQNKSNKEINEEELDKLAKHYIQEKEGEIVRFPLLYDDIEFLEAYKAGYRKAMEEMK